MFYFYELVLSSTSSTYISAEEARELTVDKLLSLSRDSGNSFNFSVTEEEEDEGNDLSMQKN